MPTKKTLTKIVKKTVKQTVKKIKNDFDHETSLIMESIEPRINELCYKFEQGVYNEATMFAFWMGLKYDLKDALEKIEKRKKVEKIKW